MLCDVFGLRINITSINLNWRRNLIEYEVSPKLKLKLRVTGKLTLTLTLTLTAACHCVRA